MPMKATYLTVNGEILSETRNGVERDYLPDPLGSTSALLDASGITDTFEYWPYGEVRSHTGSSQTPFQYVGTLGYYTDLASSRLYVRARYLQPSYARWLTVDPLWPDESAYGYVGGNTPNQFDPSGLCKTPGVSPLPPSKKSCEIYAQQCSKGYIYACNAYYACLHAGSNPVDNCMRACLQKRLKDRLLRGKATTCSDWIDDHKVCGSGEGYWNPCTNKYTLGLLCNNLFLPNATMVEPGAGGIPSSVNCADELAGKCGWSSGPSDGIRPPKGVPPIAISPKPHPCSDSSMPLPCMQTYN